MYTMNRIPQKFIVAVGSGQTSFGPGEDPFETGAYDQALTAAGIENFNIVKYTSVIPPEAEEITLADAVAEGLTHHGMVLECIMAQMNGVQGDHICAGVGRMMVKDQDGNVIGGFAAEYEGNGSREFARKQLKTALKGIFQRRGYEQKGYTICDYHFDTTDLVVDENFGTVLVALGFVTYILIDLGNPVV